MRITLSRPRKPGAYLPCHSVNPTRARGKKRMSKMPMDEQVRIAQIHAIYRNTVPGNITTLITVFLLTCGLVYLDAATRTQATVFLSIMLLQSTARFALMYAFL